MKKLLILVLPLLAAFQQSFGINKASKPQIYALVIGISDYQQSAMGKLKFAESDAIAFTNYLKSAAAGAVPDENIVMLPSRQATRREILKYADELFKKRATPEDMIIFYFSGHGIVQMGEGYLMPYEGEKGDGLSTGVEMNQLFRIIDSSPAKMKSVYIDACHAGMFPKIQGVKSVPGESNAATALVFNSLFKAASPGMMAVLSSKGTEESMEAPDLKQGLFTHFLIKGLEGSADKAPSDGVVTAGELEDYLDKGVRSYSGYVQHPSINSTFNENFPLSVTNPGFVLTNLIKITKTMTNPATGEPSTTMISQRPTAELLSDGMKYNEGWVYGQATFINKLGYDVVMYAIRGIANLNARDVLLADQEQIKTTRLLVAEVKYAKTPDLYSAYTFCFRISQNGVKKYAFVERMIEAGKNLYFELTPKNIIFSSDSSN